jgi:beta-galactosidase
VLNLSSHPSLLAMMLGLPLLSVAGGAESGANSALPARFERDFAPAEGFVRPQERPFRDEVCLNGLWQFQPVPVPPEYRRNQGVPPELATPAPAAWEATPLKIPSPWNVNTWGCGRNAGAGTPHPYRPDSVYYPSYPPAWDGVEMGWLRRTFRAPKEWKNRRVVLHFEAVAGQCQVLVNGRKAGEHFDKFLPFELDITAFVNRGEENELLVGVRHSRLYNKTSARFPKFLAPYPPGSNLEPLVGIWQDVYLLGLPDVRVDDVFVRPLLDQDSLELDVTLRNDTDQVQTVSVGGRVSPWVNLAGKGVAEAPEPKWKLGEAVLTVPAQRVQLKPGQKETVTLAQKAGAKLEPWSPEAPNLYGVVLSVERDGKTVDARYERFGWRQFKIQGRDLLLNGQRVQLFGDLCHPFGPFMMSRRLVWAWYSMIKDFGGNAVRPHANIYPRIYCDVADEMGMLVLDETALFGSSVALNFEEPAAWERFADHYDGLVLRDRNHPSVFGWSFGNELFAIFMYNPMPKEDADRFHGKLSELGQRARRLDPTREWLSCDGDDDLRGTLPVWSKHFGHGLPLEQLPKSLEKPLMVGESGGTYYARPGQLAVFNGERAYESYAGRSEALAIDLYDNLVRMARPRLAYFSASETVWFGLEHLNLGYRDFTRLPTLKDGVFFAKPFAEGKPGMQPERIPPYVTTLNPGWDPELPLYKPLAMFEAMKAALAKDGPKPCPWDHMPKLAARPAAVAPTVDVVAFAGDRSSPLFRRLWGWGVPLTADAKEAARAALLIVDGERLPGASREEARKALEETLARKGTVLFMLRGKTASLEAVARLLPAPLQLTGRTATALAPRDRNAWVAPFGLADLYFAEDNEDRQVLKCGLAGPFVERGAVLLEASNTDWSLFNEQGEDAKCGAVVLYEHLVKPSGAALVEMAHGGGRIVVSAIEYDRASPAYVAFWRKLLTNMGVKMQEPRVRWVLPTAFAADAKAAWRYALDAPPAGWLEPGFDDTAWKSGEAGFGVEVPASRPRTPWTTPDIWLRCAFALAEEDPGQLKLLVHHDEDVEVYLNGVLVLKKGGFTVKYEEFPLSEAGRKALRKGRNVLAVHCHQIAGGQYVDVGIAADPAPPGTDAKEKEHDLLRDGPRE